MIEQIVDDLALLDKLKRDHRTDSTTIAELKQSIEARKSALSECDLALLLEKQGRAQEEEKRRMDGIEHMKTRRDLRKQKRVKWGAIIVAAGAIYLAIRAELQHN
jgi:hypothetical protein